MDRIGKLYVITALLHFLLLCHMLCSKTLYQIRRMIGKLGFAQSFNPDIVFTVDIRISGARIFGKQVVYDGIHPIRRIESFFYMNDKSIAVERTAGSKCPYSAWASEQSADQSQLIKMIERLIDCDAFVMIIALSLIHISAIPGLEMGAGGSPGWM